jgi:hypothetical protein
LRVHRRSILDTELGDIVLATNESLLETILLHPLTLNCVLALSAPMYAFVLLFEYGV